MAVIYGNWCGRGSKGSGVPIDPLDACCMRHDGCYARAEKVGDVDLCDRVLMAEVEKFRDWSTMVGRTAWNVWLAFALKRITYNVWLKMRGRVK